MPMKPLTQILQTKMRAGDQFYVVRICGLQGHSAYLQEQLPYKGMYNALLNEAMGMFLST